MTFIKECRVYFDKDLFGQEWFEAFDLEIDGEIVKFKYRDFLRDNKECCIITHITKITIDYDVKEPTQEEQEKNKREWEERLRVNSDY